MERDISRRENRYSFWKKIVLIIVFFLTTPIAIGTSLLSLTFLTKKGESDIKVQAASTQILLPMSGVQVYASLPSSFPSISSEVIASDARIGLIKLYLINNNSPLTPHADYIVEVSDKYGLDFRLTTAIAQKESGLCKVIPDGSFNCWGWGIHSKGTLKFNSFEEAIDTVSKGIKENYINQGYVTVEEIMTKYAHPSSTTWAEGVINYIVQIGE